LELLNHLRIYDNGFLIGDTSVVPTVTPCSETDPGFVTAPEVAYFDPAYSHGAFFLGAGSHAITIQVIVSPFGSGIAYLRADSAGPPVPTFSQHGYLMFVVLVIGSAAFFIRRMRKAI
jgi:hypothetical protein